MEQVKGFKSVDVAAITSSRFAFMPHSTQVLYMQLLAHSDKDGFVMNPQDIQKAIGCKYADMELLAKSNYIAMSNVSNGIWVKGCATIS